MLELYTWPTGNCHKIHIMLAEVGLECRLRPVDIFRGEQFDPSFLALNPNNKVPVLVDHTARAGGPLIIFETGAILQYLAEITGKLMPTDTFGRYEVLKWLNFQTACVGPMMGQALHFRHFARAEVAYGIERFTNETGRLFRVVEKGLGAQTWIAGDYSIADIALFPWLRRHEELGQDVAAFPAMAAWLQRMDARPAVRSGLSVMAGKARRGPMSDDIKEVLFGSLQYRPR